MYFFGLKIYTLGIFLGQEICHVFFLGLKKIRVFFWVLSPSELFVSGIHCDQKLLRYLSLVIFWVGSFDARYFFGSKISGLCIFLGLQYEAPSEPPVMYTSSTPPGW